MQMQAEMGIERNNDKLTISMPIEMPDKLSHLDWVMQQLTILAEVMQASITEAMLLAYCEDLVDLDRASLTAAFRRARRELKFFPKIATLREFADAGRERQQDAEARKAWDVLITFVQKYVSNDVHGNYGPEHGWYPKSHPRLSDRILDTVRRTGGWKVYACMTDEDFPFVQKRFFEEYAAWIAVQQIAPSRMPATRDVETKFKRLATSKAMP